MQNLTRTFTGLISAALFNIVAIQGMELSLPNDQKLANDMALCYLTTNITDGSYKNNRLDALSLVKNKADINLTVYPNGDSRVTSIGHVLLERATRHSDTELLAALFERNANPDMRSVAGVPIFFYAKDLAVIQEFVNRKVNLNAIKVTDQTNVLRKALHHKYPAELLQLYITEKIDLRNISYPDNSCLFHELATLCETFSAKDRANFFRKSYLLLTNCADVLNTVNNKNQTPLDLALKILDIESNYTHLMNTHRMKLGKGPKGNDRQDAAKLIVNLYKRYGGLQAEELVQ